MRAVTRALKLCGQSGGVGERECGVGDSERQRKAGASAARGGGGGLCERIGDVFFSEWKMRLC